jgi:CelD/BcsL family acetyltransferase involved in cellulose biosynthesis
MTVDPMTAPAPHVLDAAAAIASARRAVVADRYAVDSFAIEWREFSRLEEVADEWRALAVRALAANVFYEPAFALAAGRLFGRDAGAVLVWSGTRPRKLLGFFPARIAARRYVLKLPVLMGWTHPFAPLSTPLVERDAAEPVIASWLAYLAGNVELPGLLLLPFLPQEGPFTSALAAILRRRQMQCAGSNCHTRALLAPGGERADYVRHALGAHKYGQLRRTMRRLGEAGGLLFDTATEPADVAAAYEEFLALEASGWKGQAGTAIACRHEIRDFVTAAVAALALEGKVAIDRILLEGRAVAASITLRSGDNAWFWKIAYDESLARCGPGAMLTALVTERLAEDVTIACADSCAPAEHAVINRNWSERLPLWDLLIALRPQAPFARARRLELLRQSALASINKFRRRFRR